MIVEVHNSGAVAQWTPCFFTSMIIVIVLAMSKKTLQTIESPRMAGRKFEADVKPIR
jgi:hypothetical protein